MLPQGYKHSPEARLKISKAKMGEKNPFYGKKHTEESNMKRREWCKNNIEKLSGNKGVKLSEEIKKKMSLAHIGKSNGLKGKKKGPPSAETRLKQSIAQRGERGSNWKGGVTLLMNIIRHCFKYRQWVSDIYTRDNYICQICGVRGNKLNADHIKPFALIFHENHIKTLEQALECEAFWNLNNGRTLCVPCHKKTDTYGRPRKIKGYFTTKEINYGRK